MTTADAGGHRRRRRPARGGRSAAHARAVPAPRRPRGDRGDPGRGPAPGGCAGPCVQARSGQARRRRRCDPQLRIGARVPAGGLLHRGRAGRLAARRAGQQARVVGSHERAHVKAFQQTLGAGRDEEPELQLPRRDRQPQVVPGDRGRVRGSGGRRLQGAAAEDQLGRYLAGAISIHSVEARHAAWIRDLAGIVPAEHAFDAPLPDHETPRSSTPRTS